MPEGSGSDHAHSDFTLRMATADDLDDITQIHLDGFREEPQVHYCYPLRDEYPEDYWRWTRAEYAGYLKDSQKFLVHVIDHSSKSKGKVVKKIAGLAVWNLAVLTKATHADLGLEKRKDTNKKHCEAFYESAGKRFQTYFAKWAEEQINLSALVVHPDFRRQGAGTMLVNWGIKAAHEKGWPVTLCASPMGKLLYEHLKFERIATEVVRAEDEEETMSSAVMVLRENGVVGPY